MGRHFHDRLQSRHGLPPPRQGWGSRLNTSLRQTREGRDPDHPRMPARPSCVCVCRAPRPDAVLDRPDSGGTSAGPDGSAHRPAAPRTPSSRCCRGHTAGRSPPASYKTGIRIGDWSLRDLVSKFWPSVSASGILAPGHGAPCRFVYRGAGVTAPAPQLRNLRYCRPSSPARNSASSATRRFGALFGHR